MGRQRPSAAEGRLAIVQAQVDRWRRTRAKQSPMPERLWDDAVVLARELGVHPVKAALGLNYESLRHRLEGSGASVKPESGFVELSGAQLLGSAGTGPVVEVSDERGMRLTVRLAPGSELDLARLVEAFRRDA